MPIDATDIERLAQILEHCGIASIEIEENGRSLRLVMENTEPTAPLPSLAPIARPSDATVIAKAKL